MGVLTTLALVAGGVAAATLGSKEQGKAGDALSSFSPAGFSSPGLSGSFNRNTNSFNLNRTAEGEAALSDVRGGFEGLSEEIRGLRPDVKPGFGRLTKSRIEAIRAAGSRTVGNLREELGKRRVLGSSFASREIASTEAEFGRIEEAARAESFLQEFELTRQLISDEFQSSIAGATAVLSQLNFETTLAANLSASASQQNQNISVATAEMRSAAASGFFELAGTLFGLGKSTFGGARPSTA